MSALSVRFAREFPRGEVLFREGDPGECMYVVQSGTIEISRTLAGTERVLATLGRGEFLGEMALLNHKPRNATATVIEDARCLVIDKQILESMLTHSPEIALRLVKKLARRLDAADAMVEILVNPDPRARVLLGLKRKLEERAGTSDKVSLDLVRDDVAREVGADPAKLGEVLLRLRRLKIASFEDGAPNAVTIEAARFFEFLEFLDAPRRTAGGVGAD